MDKIDRILDNDPAFWENTAAVSVFFKREVREHFQLEEKVLFPVMLKVLPETARSALVHVQNEHAPMLREVEAMERLTEDARLHHSPELRELLIASYIHVLDVFLLHARKEDDEIFPLLQQYFGAREQQELEKLYCCYLSENR